MFLAAKQVVTGCSGCTARPVRHNTPELTLRSLSARSVLSTGRQFKLTITLYISICYIDNTVLVHVSAKTIR